jgi:hypothetical protein
MVGLSREAARLPLIEMNVIEHDGNQLSSFLCPNGYCILITEIAAMQVWCLFGYQSCPDYDLES